MIDDPTVEARGLVLVGPNEAMDLNRAACLSAITGIKLSFTYVNN